MTLVIGTGYIGTPLAETLLARGEVVHAASRTAPDRPTSLPVHTCDVSDLASVQALAAALPSQPSSVVHCASSGRGGAPAYEKVYLDGMRHLAATFPGARLLFTSSSSVYAQTDRSRVDEASPAKPDRETGRLLLAAEQVATSNGGTVARLAGIYGPGRSVLLLRFLEGRAVIDGDPASQNPQPGRLLNQAHRDDIVAALVTLIADNGLQGVFNVCDDRPLTQHELYTELSARFDLPLPPVAPPATDRKRGWTNKRLSNARLRTTGWRPRFPSYLDALGGDPELVPSVRALVSGEL